MAVPPRWEYQRRFTRLRCIEIDIDDWYGQPIPDTSAQPTVDGSNLALDVTDKPLLPSPQSNETVRVTILHLNSP